MRTKSRRSATATRFARPGGCDRARSWLPLVLSIQARESGIMVGAAAPRGLDWSEQDFGPERTSVIITPTIAAAFSHGSDGYAPGSGDDRVVSLLDRLPSRLRACHRRSRAARARHSSRRAPTGPCAARADH